MKTIITAYLLLLVFTGKSQNKKDFFQAVSITSLVGNQSYETGKNQWKHLFKDRKTFPYVLDTMSVNDFGPKCGLFFPDVGAGIGVTFSKTLLHTNGWSGNKKKLEWKTGLFYKTSVYRPLRDGYASVTPYSRVPVDTAKIYVSDFVTLKQKKAVVEWQNYINVKTGSFFKNTFRFNVGTGFSVSSTVTNKIDETYSQTKYTWSTQYRYFIPQTSVQGINAAFKANRETKLNYFLNLATEIRLSSQMALSSDFQYTISHYKYSYTKASIESFWLGISLHYAFNP